MVFMTSFSLIESVFIAFRDAKFVLIKNSIFSVLKLIFPFFLISFGAFGIFGSWTISAAIAFFTMFVYLKRKYGFSLINGIRKYVLKKMFTYSLSNYVAGFIGSFPNIVLPLMIVNMLGPEIGAYFYISTMITGILDVIPMSTCNSFFAEGSSNKKQLKKQMWKSFMIIFLILIPLVLLTVFFGKYMLLLFGTEYSLEGLTILRLMAVSTLIMSVQVIFGTILKIKDMMKELIIISAFSTIMTLSVIYLMMPFGLTGVGIGWLIGQCLTLLVYVIFLRRKIFN
jgi:O-antigen/teichoic acid export membrane protein